jgi:alkylation response protein AidB-like acyl-CoA dehydrogenase
VITQDSASPFELSADQSAIGDLARDFAQGQIAPFIERWDKAHTFPRDLYSKLNAIGLMGMLVPEEFGGVQTDYISYALAIEELAKVDAGTAVSSVAPNRKMRGSRNSVRVIASRVSR